jgi:hypothetical protein
MSKDKKLKKARPLATFKQSLLYSLALAHIGLGNGRRRLLTIRHQFHGVGCRHCPVVPGALFGLFRPQKVCGFLAAVCERGLVRDVLLPSARARLLHLHLHLHLHLRLVALVADVHLLERGRRRRRGRRQRETLCDVAAVVVHCLVRRGAELGASPMCSERGFQFIIKFQRSPKLILIPFDLDELSRIKWSSGTRTKNKFVTQSNERINKTTFFLQTGLSATRVLCNLPECTLQPRAHLQLARGRL